MPRRNESRGAELDRQMSEAAATLRRLPREGLRQLPVVRGLNPSCSVDGGLENVLHDITEILVGSGRVFLHGNAVKLEVGRDDDKRLETLMTGGVLEKGAAQRLANIFTCEKETKSGITQFPPTDAIVSAVLLREPTQAALPRIQAYATRPVFDVHYRLRNPGWHPEEGILVHGPAIQINGDYQPASVELPAIQRLPPHLQRLLQDFCFASDADVANTVGVMLTGLLMTQFVTEGHPMIVMDGNQPGVGKTLLARVINLVLDGVDPRVVGYNPNDEELQKQVLATLRSSPQACVIIDNAKTSKGVVHSPFLEANTVAPEISLRILSTSSNYVRPNDVLWYLTMNDTQLSSDLVSRNVAIRFKHEGDPNQRSYRGRPIEYARRNRAAILAELAEMVLYWTRQGRPSSDRPHRIPTWSQTIGGILAANGLPEFLSNQQQAACEFNAELEELAAVAEQAAATKKCWFCSDATDEAELNALIIKNGLPANKWSELIKNAEIQEGKLSGKGTAKGLGKRIGNFLTQYLGREITILHQDREIKAVLRKGFGRSNATVYCFQQLSQPEQQLDEPVAGAKATEASSTASQPPAAKTCRSASKEPRATAFPAGANPKATVVRQPAAATCGGNDEPW